MKIEGNIFMGLLYSLLVKKKSFLKPMRWLKGLWVLSFFLLFSCSQHPVRDYTWGVDLSSGLLPVVVEDRWGYIDREGNMKISPKFHEVHDFSERLAGVRNLRGKWGFIDPQGELVIPFRFEQVSRFSEGLCAVRLEKKWGYIDTSGKLVISPQFAEAGRFYKGKACVKTKQWDKRQAPWWGFGFITGATPPAVQTFCIDRKGNRLSRAKPLLGPDQVFAYYETPVRQRFMQVNRGEMREGFFFTREEKIGVISGKSGFGYIHSSGKVLVSPQFDQAYPFSEGLACVVKDGKRGYIDTSGKVVIAIELPLPRQFHHANSHSFQGGMAIVGTDYIDKAGEVVITGPFDDVWPFSHGRAKVRVGNKWGYIDTKGEFIWKFSK